MPEGSSGGGRPAPKPVSTEEDHSNNHVQRIEWAVPDSDGAVAFTLNSHLTGGSKKTANFAGVGLLKERHRSMASAAVNSWLGKCG